ncbi:antA/AntB antirepressor family protein [Streptococcus pluranimalium]|uniref:antA/AntB antirepressor family protein n=1 Tax=Streptococcus pluranimalium TaxID=82348 RepID=UPI003F68D4F8
MQEIIKINLNKENEPVVSARELHKGLKVKTRFSQWVEQNFKILEDGYDFTSVVTTTQLNQYGGTKQIQDYALSLDAAKNLAMVSKTDEGAKVRKYFIQVEKEFKAKALESTDESLAKRLRAEAMDRNSRTRQAQLISKFADKVSPVAHDLLLVHATELMLQKQIEYKPEIRPTYSATEIGKKLGISANKVGKLANANNLKNDRFGLTVLSKSKYSAKQLSTFVYYEEVVPVLRKILEESA